MGIYQAVSEQSDVLEEGKIGKLNDFEGPNYDGWTTRSEHLQNLQVLRGVPGIQ